MSARVLVIVLADIRSDRLTIESFCHHVLQPLKAELALCVRRTDEQDEYRSRARYIWEFDEGNSTWAQSFDQRAAGRDWRSLLELGGPWMEGPGQSPHPHCEAASPRYFYRDLLREQIDKHALADEYDWFIITRSDFMWPIRHPAIEWLSSEHIWFPDGERHTGLTDRHAVVPRQYIRAFLDIPRPIFEAPEGLARDMRAVGRDNWNTESFIQFRMEQLGLLKRVKFFPYFMFIVRSPETLTNDADGNYSPAHRYFIKYATEFESSLRVQLVVTSPQRWRSVIGLRRFLSWRMYALAFLMTVCGSDLLP